MPPKYTKVSDPSIIKEEILMPSTIETIDYALHDWLDEKLNIHSNSNKGWKKVPIIWVSAERAFQIKDNKDLRDSKGLLKLPLITIERSNIVKNPERKGVIQAGIPPIDDEKGGSIIIAKRIQQDKTTAFANSASARKRSRKMSVGHGQINFRTRKNNSRVVYETISIPIPVYLDITYSLNIRTEYLQQINDIMTPFATRTGGLNYFGISRDGHKYEAFIQQEFAQENNVANMEENERTYNMKIDINVLGYIIGGDKNEERPKIVIRENAVDLKFKRERTMVGDMPEHIDVKRAKYRE